MRDGLHLSGKGASVFTNELSAPVDNGMRSIKNIFGNKYFKTRSAGVYLEVSQTGKETTSTQKSNTMSEKMSDAGRKCVFKCNEHSK